MRPSVLWQGQSRSVVSKVAFSPDPAAAALAHQTAYVYSTYPCHKPYLFFFFLFFFFFFFFFLRWRR